MRSFTPAFFMLIQTTILFSNTHLMQQDSFSQALINRVMNIELPQADAVDLQEAHMICDNAMQAVHSAYYEKAIEIILFGLEKYPSNFVLQSDLAALIGDCSEIVSYPLKEKMITYSKKLFGRLLKEADKQSKSTVYTFMNEYCYRFAQYDRQYESGVKCVNDYWQTDEFEKFGIKGYYYQGVGAANYARMLFEAGDKEQAQQYAQKAIIAWAQYFSYKNDYYNAYVHYALALGICGHREEMMRALCKSASLIGKDLSYFEFKEVIDFINAAEKIETKKAFDV